MKLTSELGLEVKERNPIQRGCKPKCLLKTGRIAQQASLTQYSQKRFWLILRFIQSIIDLQNNLAFFISLGKALICKVLFGKRKPEFFSFLKKIVLVTKYRLHGQPQSPFRSKHIVSDSSVFLVWSMWEKNRQTASESQTRITLVPPVHTIK